MIYRPQTGIFKDNHIFYENGTYYLFSMYLKDADGARDETGYRNVFLATSQDGVHWEDKGAVISDAPFPVWAMMVYKIPGGYMLNHGSFGREGYQNVIKLWRSPDLTHWEYLGEDYDVYPDYTQCARSARLDCLYVLHEEDCYYGFATGPQWLFRSQDGLHWQSMPNPEIAWGDFPPSPMPPDEGIFEVAGCEKIGGRYYLIGGWFNYLGYSGYGDYVLVADSVTGPYRPCSPKFRLNGQSERWVCLWARYLRNAEDLLVSSYMVDGYSFECGTTWLPPLKKVVREESGCLSLRYWAGNEALKGEPLRFSAQEALPVAFLQKYGKMKKGAGLELYTDKVYSSLCRIGSDICGAYIPVPCLEKGAIAEGKFCVTNGSPRESFCGAGFYLAETEHEGTGILLRSYGAVKIGHMYEKNGEACFRTEDEARCGICATATGIAAGREHNFRLLVKGNMFELYIDDLLVQSFNTAHSLTHEPRAPIGIGFLAENGKLSVSALKLWRFSV